MSFQSFDDPSSKINAADVRPPDGIIYWKLQHHQELYDEIAQENSELAERAAQQKAQLREYSQLADINSILEFDQKVEDLAQKRFKEWEATATEEELKSIQEQQQTSRVMMWNLYRSRGKLVENEESLAQKKRQEEDQQQPPTLQVSVEAETKDKLHEQKKNEDAPADDDDQ